MNTPAAFMISADEWAKAQARIAELEAAGDAVTEHQMEDAARIAEREAIVQQSDKDRREIGRRCRIAEPEETRYREALERIEVLSHPQPCMDAGDCAGVTVPNWTEMGNIARQALKEGE